MDNKESRSLINNEIGSSKVITEEASKRITSLRFLLIVLVVFIHNNINDDFIAELLATGSEPILFAQNNIGKWIQIVISDGIAMAAVPLFFLFSSYLFFMKPNKYIVMLKKKFYSLFIPLLLWAAINLFFFVFSKIVLLKIAPQFVSNPDSFIFTGWTIRDWVSAFLGFTRDKEIKLLSNYSTYGGTLAGQFWFIRDLIILMVISPVIQKLVQKLPVEFFILSTFFYFCDIRPIVVMHQAWFFFVLGCYFAEYNYDFFAFADKIHWKWIIVLFGITFVYFISFTTFSNKSRYLPIICSCIIFLKFSRILINNDKLFAISSYLSRYSFFLFAAHENFYTPIVQNIWIKVFPMKNAFFCLFEYFGVTLFVICSLTIFGILINKFFPKVFRFLNGGR